MSMRKIDDVLPSMLESIDQRRRAYRARQIERWGFEPDCECAECGDVGTLPDRPERYCPSCETGRSLADQHRREQEWASLCPRRFRDYRLETHPATAAVAEVRDWLRAGVGRGQNLILSGPIGTGKTGLAIGALRVCFVAGRTVRYGTVPDLMEAMRPKDADSANDETESIRVLQRVQVLLLDDLGTEKPSEWQAEQLYMIVNGRYERGRPTVITTNRNDLDERLGGRVMSRLREDLRTVFVGGGDLRRTADRASALYVVQTDQNGTERQRKGSNRSNHTKRGLAALRGQHSRSEGI